MKRFEVVFNIPSPYRLHMLNAMWQELKTRGIEFHVHFMAKGHKERPKSWLNPKIDFPHTYWRDLGVGQYHFNPGMILYFLFHKCDWLLNGSPYDTFTGILLSLFARRTNMIAGAEGNTKTPGIVTGFVGWFKHFIYSRSNYASVPGHDAIRYFELHQRHTHYKMPQPVIMPNLVDETRFRPRPQWPSDEIESLRCELLTNSSASRICLIPARLTEVKGLIPFIDHLESDWVKDWKIVILGQGHLKDAILAKAKAKGIMQNLTILDYVSYDKMPLYYAASDLLLLPSIYDPNPLSVPEALFSGLPIALSDKAGNVEEGVTNGKNGWILPVSDSVAYAKTLHEVFTASSDTLCRKGAQSLTCNAEFWRTKKAVRFYMDELGVH